MSRHACALLGMLAIWSAMPFQAAYAEDGVVGLQPGTKLYLVTDKGVTSARGESDVGMVIPCRIWRDVEQGGVLFLKAGTLASCQVDKIKRRNMGGSEGKLSIAGMDTKAVDGQQVMLSGGYNKEGSGRKAVVWTVGLLLLWPVLFVPGGAAELPPGTVFDVTTVNEVKIHTVAASTTAGAPHLNLSSMMGGLSAEILLDDLLQQKGMETLRIKLKSDAELPAKFVIDSVNGKTIDPLATNITSPQHSDSESSAVLETKLKPLAKHFQKGINRFEIAYQEGAERKATELILDIQM